MTIIAMLILSPIIVLGLFCIYAGYRFSRKGVDKTAAFWHWLNMVWILSTQAEQLAELIPELTEDLSEVYGFQNDGKIT